MGKATNLEIPQVFSRVTVLSGLGDLGGSKEKSKDPEACKQATKTLCARR